MGSEKEPSEKDDSTPVVKLVLLGDGGTGKTTLIKQLLTGEFETKYEPTFGVEIHPITVETSKGSILFNCWDTNGQEKHGKLRDEYYRDAQFAIILFDVTSRLTYKNVPLWLKDIKRVSENVEVVICGNKVDVENRQVKLKQVVFPRRKGIPYLETSAKSNYNCEKPFLHFARSLLQDEELQLVGDFPFAEAEIEMDADLQKRLDEEMEKLKLERPGEESDEDE
ncbi:hypothetical protein BSKO_01145 [Bryopsis sp. KO-2023]|nr:hypothetical protein BSKO_01145 [Bryopsis sp. KO-2023]